MDDYRRRLGDGLDELRSLHYSIYHDKVAFDRLLDMMEDFASCRSDELRTLDRKREDDSFWFMDKGAVGMTLYTELYGGDLKGVASHIDHLKDLGVTYLHLMPFTTTPLHDNDGGFAVSDYENVDSRLGTNGDLEELARLLRKEGISLCMDFVMNHSSDEHEWAMRAKAGEKEYQDYYLCFDDRTIPDEYEKTVPEVFPETAPGNFVWSREMGKWVFSSFYPKQWDLNYANPALFAAMVKAMLLWANRGVEAFRLDAVPYIWKRLGTSCRNLEEVHVIVRMIRLILSVVAPAVILKGEVVMAPKELAAYFGTPDRPECHILYGASGMVNIWGALSSMDTRLLYSQSEDFLALPANAVFLNYLRCHDDIGWGFDEDRERQLGIDPLLHKIYQYEFYSGRFPLSYARGELYNYDPKTKDARSCGTTASLVGIEAALESGDGKALEMALRRFELLYTVVYSMRGFPLINSGDEVGMLNDYSYRDDPDRKDDSRYVHRMKLDWNKVALSHVEGTVEKRLSDCLRRLKTLRSASPFFAPQAEVLTWHAHNDRVFALRRRIGDDLMLLVFSFSPNEEEARFDFFTGLYKDAFTGRIVEPGRGVRLSPYERLWLTRV